MADTVCKTKAFENHGGEVRKLLEFGKRSRDRAGRRGGIKLSDKFLMNGRVGKDVISCDSQRMCPC